MVSECSLAQLLISAAPGAKRGVWGATADSLRRSVACTHDQLLERPALDKHETDEDGGEAERGYDADELTEEGSTEKRHGDGFEVADEACLYRTEVAE